MNRAVKIEIGGSEYEMLLTTRALREILERFGSLETISQRFSEDAETKDILSDAMWLMVTLINQTILRYNIQHKDAPKDLLTVEELEIMTTPDEIMKQSNNMIEAISIGAGQHIKSEDDPKNVMTE